MDLTSGYSMSMPILSAKELPSGAYAVEGEILGSCFSIGQNFVITANHVVRDWQQGVNDMIVGLYGPGDSAKGARVTGVEHLACDIACVEVTFPSPESEKWFNRFKWDRQQQNPFSRVRAVGYAYGMQQVGGERRVVVRGFEGHVVSRLNSFAPLGYKGTSFAAYELSFCAPRGLSGAPVLNSSGSVLVHGIVIGNSEARMTVFRSKEREESTAETTVVEQYEALTLGVAVPTDQILPVHSNLLGGTVEEHLDKVGLL